MLSKRLFLGHGTVVAYVALFIALGGSGYAATRIATESRSAPVKVRCSALQGRRRVACKVVKGSGVGPRGPRGPGGPRGLGGPSGAAGPSSYTEVPAFSFLTQPNTGPGVTAVDVNTGTLHPNDEYQNFAVFTNNSEDVPATAPGKPVFRTYLLSPGELDGSPAHLASVQFCYGFQDDPAKTTTISFTNASVVEFDDPASGAGAGPITGYTPVSLFDMPLTNTVAGTVAGSGGCETVTPPSAPAINPDGYLALDLTGTFTAPNSSTGGDQVLFGRVTTTYSP